MIKQIKDIAIQVNEEGYLTDFSQWNREIAIELAKEDEIELTEKHWQVLTWIQEQVAQNKPLSIRGIKTSGVVDIKEFYALFPGGPLKVSTKIAGVPKPKSCI